MIELARRAASDRNLPSRLTLDLDIGNSRRLASSLSLRASLSRAHAKGLKDAFSPCIAGISACSRILEFRFKSQNRPTHNGPGRIRAPTSAVVKGFGCRPFPDACRRAALGPASESLQRRKPRVGRAGIRRRELWGFESCPRLLAGGRDDHQRRFRRMERSQGVFRAGDEMMFFAVAVFGRAGRRVFGRTPAVRSKGSRQKRVGLRRCG